MAKNFSNYPEIKVIRKNNFSKKLRLSLKICCFIFIVFVLVLLFSPLFNITLFKQDEKPLVSSYYIIYTECEQTEDIFEQSQELRFRGASGNITKINEKDVIILNQCKTMEECQKITKNLTNQDINAKWYAQDFKIDLKNENTNNKKMISILFETQSHILDELLVLPNVLDKNQKNETEVSIEIFELYSTLESVSLSVDNDLSEKTKNYYAQVIKIQSLLYLLSRKEHMENNISYSSLIRYYTFKILEILKTF